MENSKQNSSIIIAGVVVVAIFILLMRNFLLSNQLQQLQQDVNELQYDFDRVSQQLNIIIGRKKVSLTPI